MSVETGTHLFEVTNRDLDGLPDARGESVRAMLAADHGIEVASVRVILGYQVRTDLAEEEADSMVQDLFVDPIIEFGTRLTRLLDDFPEAPSGSNLFAPGPIATSTDSGGFVTSVTFERDSSIAGVASRGTAP